MFAVTVAALLSLTAFFVYFQRGDLLLYGDAVAHIGIARRVLDSITPGINQIGTVWLPLPHLLMLPFVASTRMWQTGAAASIPSLVAFVLAAMAVFRITRIAAQALELASASSIAWLAMLAFACNPSLLYLQTTAMTEPIYLAAFLWAAVWLCDLADPSVANSRRAAALVACSVCLFAAQWTRYDGWFVLPVFVVIAVFLSVRNRLSRIALLAFLLIALAAPLLWITWNWKNYGNPLEFATGPYSARGIAQRTTPKGTPPPPGTNSLAAATQVYVHSAELTLGEKRWGVALFWGALAGTLTFAIAARRSPRALIVLLLWLPLPFYAWSIAYGSVPIFLPLWWPFSYYNTRYGLELLPGIAIGAALGTGLAIEAWRRRRPQLRSGLAFALAATFVGAAYLSCYVQNPNRPRDPLPGEPFHGPIVWREAATNARTRVAFEAALADALSRFPERDRILMYTGDHIGALQGAGILLRRVVNEANYYAWQEGLHDPASLNIVVAMDGDPVSAALAGGDPAKTPPLAGLHLVAVIRPEGQPVTRIFQSTRTAAGVAPKP